MINIFITQLYFFFLFHFNYIYVPYFPRIKEADYLKHNSEDLKHFKNINLYSLSSFSYTFLGLFALKYKLNNYYFDSYMPYFVMIQGPISYISDSIYVDKYHWIHDLDISLASYNFTYTFYIYYSNYTIWKLNIFYSLFFIIGKLFHLISRDCFKNKEYKNYKIFHILWHLTIPCEFMIILYKINNQ